MTDPWPETSIAAFDPLGEIAIALTFSRAPKFFASSESGAPAAADAKLIAETHTIK